MTYVKDLETYCDTSCHAIVSYFAFEGYLHNFEGVCQESCPENKVNHLDGAEHYCDASCHDLKNFLDLNSIMYNENNTCVLSMDDVIFEKDQEVYTDASCDKIADFLNTTYL